MQEGETRVEPNGLHELERQLGRPKHLKCSEQSPKEERAARRGNSLGSCSPSAQEWACGKSLRPRREALDRVRGTLSALTRAGSSACRYPPDSWGIAQSAHKCFLSAWGIVCSMLKTLDPPNESQKPNIQEDIDRKSVRKCKLVFKSQQLDLIYRTLYPTTAESFFSVHTERLARQAIFTEIPWRPSGWDFALSLRRALVQSLGQELRPSSRVAQPKICSNHTFPLPYLTVYLL